MARARQLELQVVRVSQSESGPLGWQEVTQQLQQVLLKAVAVLPEVQTYPFVMLNLSDAVTWSQYASLSHTGDNLRNLFGPKVLWISVAAAQ